MAKIESHRVETRRAFVGQALAGLGAWATLGAIGCDPESNPVAGPTGVPFEGCDLDIRFLLATSERDAAQSLDDPVWLRADQAIPGYLDPDTRVVGVEASGQRYAIPHNILWHHEIVNLDSGGPSGDTIAITYCPLTGSALVFDREVVGRATLGVSGLLYFNNLLLYDRRTPESLWPQMLARAGCGAHVGTQLPQFHFVELHWSEWVRLYPDTFVLAEDQGFDPLFFEYHALGYPYGPYRQVAAHFTGAMPEPDPRRFAKDRMIGLPSTDRDVGIAFPFDALAALSGRYQAIDLEYESQPAVLLWSDDAHGGSAYRSRTTSGTPVTLSATQFGFFDDTSGSEFSVDGRAVAGPLVGSRLEPVVTTHTAFWFAWVAYHPNTRLWVG